MKSRLAIVTSISLALMAVLLVALTGNTPASAAQPAGGFKPVISRDVAHDTSAPLRELAKRLPAKTNRPTSMDAVNRRIPNRFDDPKFLAELKERGIDLSEYLAALAQPDAVVQSHPGVPYAPNALPPTIHNFEGISQNEMQDVVPGTGDNYVPPDTDGDVGYDPATGKKYYVQYVNTAYAIWDVTNPTPIRLLTATGNALWSGFGGECEANNDGDPIVLFDQLSNRWLMSQFALPGGTAGFHQCIAISTSGDPTGAWYRYDFLVSLTKLNDYPKFGVWPDGYYMSINQFNPSTLAWWGAGALAFERQRMLQGLSAQMIYFDLYDVNANFSGQLPSDWDGITPPPASTPNYFAEVDDNGVTPALGPDALRIWKFHVDWTTPANSTFGVNGTPNSTVAVSPYTAICPATRSCVPQPGTTTRLDAIGDRVMFRGAYRNINGHETLLLNHTVDAGSGRAGVRWYEVRDVSTAPVIYQQGTYAPADTEHRWMGSIAMDHVGNIALGYSVASSSVYPSVRYTGRLASDPPGVMAQGESVIVIGTGSQTSSARWGDYSSLTLDPVDDCTFWYTQEYYAVTTARDWQTRIASFRFPNCTIGAQGRLAGLVTDASNSNPIVGARVAATLDPTQTFTTFSGPGGNYAIMAPAGAYTVTGAAYGYLPAVISDVSIVAGMTLTQDIALTPAATYVISGYIRDSATAGPLWATVAVSGTPFNPPFASVQTDPATGFYSMTVSGAQSYTLTAAALLHTPASQPVTPVGNTTANFDLVATTQNGAIAGWVRNFYTSDPISNATVVVATIGNPSDQTDANGYFEILDLAPGNYTATASANLYSPIALDNIQVLTSNVAIRTFLLPTSQLNYYPAQLNKTLMVGQIATDTTGLVISNTGLGALTFELQEMAGGFAPLRPALNDFVVVNDDVPTTSSFTQTLTSLGYTYEVMPAANFNLMTPAALLGYKGVLYAGNNPGGGSLSLFTQYLDAGGRLLISGNDVGYYNGSSTFYRQYLEAEYIADNATEQNGSAAGEDIMDGLGGSIAADPFPDQFAISGTHAVRIFVYSTTGPGHNSPAGSRIARGDYQAVYFPFRLYYLGTSAIGEPIERDVLARALTWLVDSTAALPWISEAPITGTLLQNNSQNIQLAWNAVNAPVTQPGTYTGTLSIGSNDPAAQGASVPVIMQVNPAAYQGLLTGVVSTTGICDVHPAPLNGVRVFVQGSAGFTLTLSTNATGQYGYWLDQTQNPYTVTVSHADHLTVTAIADVSGGVTTTQNFTLRLQKPCITYTPHHLSATTQSGSRAPSQTLEITSSGALSLDFKVFEVPGILPASSEPDDFGYTWITSTFNYISASSGGIALNLTDDSEVNIVSPFPIAYYGDSSTSLRVGNNGAVLFDATIGDVDFANTAMTEAPDNLIATFWDDLDDETGNVYWLVTGTAPNRKLVIEWYNRPHYQSSGGVGAASFEVVFFENGNILYQYLDTDFGSASYNSGASATAGLRGTGATNSLQYSFDQAVLTDGLSVCFVRPDNPPCDAVDVPWLTVTPGSTTGLTGTPPSSQQLTVGFDATSLPLSGTYTASLLIAHNAPQPAVSVPVTFTVTAYWDFIRYLPVIYR